ncbi:hypothetical protein SUGI_0437460 [Cryptomeria japonica]|uniref:UPF0496 protein At4g34320-like n=1 Tax=Cryptomeria japonica TaxID=3369 RepID=UPI002408B998|nr:UPF0496 protein At4g34320-like [Cryptomeria japonica]GLJ23169.1 hypothetical protein SUGI_0437460 [Cryptomeria japonica]
MGSHMSCGICRKATKKTDCEGNPCETDADMKKFGEGLKAHIGRIIKVLESGTGEHSLSLDSLKDVTSCFLEMDQKVLDLILDSNKDIWNDPDLRELVKDYLDSSKETLRFYTGLQDSLRRANDNQLIIQNALQYLATVNPPPGEAQYRKVMEGLDEFKTAVDPFNEEFFRQFESIGARQEQILVTLAAKRKKLSIKLKKVLQIFCIIFVSTLATVLICSVVVPAVTASPVVNAMAAISSIAMRFMPELLDFLWIKYETVKERREVIDELHKRANLRIEELEKIRVSVEKLESTIDSILRSVDFCSKGNALQIVVEDIKEKQQSFKIQSDYLFDHVDRCSLNLDKARDLVFQKFDKSI